MTAIIAVNTIPQTTVHDQVAGMVHGRKRLQSSDIKTPAQKKLYQKAQEFEAVFMNQLLAAMRKTVGKNELFSGGQAEEMFSGMLDQSYANSATNKQGGMGLVDDLYRQLSINQFAKMPVSNVNIAAAVDIQA